MGVESGGFHGGTIAAPAAIVKPHDFSCARISLTGDKLCFQPKNAMIPIMIRLSRFDGVEILLNIDLISQVESTPATVITLLNGEKIKVKNNETDVITKIKAARQGRYEENRDPNEPPESNRPPRRFAKR
jgi:uncharacterized protein YlzI (FlbEa/FlbD family)